MVTEGPKLHGFMACCGMELKLQRLDEPKQRVCEGTGTIYGPSAHRCYTKQTNSG